MKHYPRLHDTYIARSVITSVLLTWGVLLGLDVVLAFAGEVGDIGKGGYTANHAIAATGLTIPWRAYNLFPTAAVIGALLGLGQLRLHMLRHAVQRAIAFGHRHLGGLTAALKLLHALIERLQALQHLRLQPQSIRPRHRLHGAFEPQQPPKQDQLQHQHCSHQHPTPPRHHRLQAFLSLTAAPAAELINS